MIARNDDEPQESPGGLGGESGLTRLKEVRLAARAISEDWDLEPEDRRDVLNMFREIVNDKKASYRERIAAGRGMIEADRTRIANKVADKPGANVLVIGSPHQRAIAVLDCLLEEADSRGLVVDGEVIGGGDDHGDCDEGSPRADLPPYTNGETESLS